MLSHLDLGYTTHVGFPVPLTVIIINSTISIFIRATLRSPPCLEGCVQFLASNKADMATERSRLLPTLDPQT